jgi:hypothetical protein
MHLTFRMSPVGSVITGPLALFEEDLRVEEEAVSFLKTQTKLVERLKVENEKKDKMIERLCQQLAERDRGRSELQELYGELRGLEDKLRLREEQQAKREGELAARIDHLKGTEGRLRETNKDLERELQVGILLDIIVFNNI